MHTLAHPADDYGLQRRLRCIKRTSDSLPWVPAFLREQRMGNPRTQWRITESGKQYMEQQLPRMNQHACASNIDIQTCISLSLRMFIYEHLIEHDGITMQDIHAIMDAMEPPTSFDPSSFMKELMNEFEIFCASNIGFMTLIHTTFHEDVGTRAGIQSLFSND